MRRIIGVALSTLLVLGMLGVGAWQLLGGRLPSRAGAASPQGASSPANLAAVRAVVGSEKKAFFADPDVKAIFARSGISVDVDTAGSREIATSTDLKAYHLAFPSSAPAAERIKRKTETLGVYSPFYSPMAIVSFQPIVDLLERVGLPRRLRPVTGLSTSTPISSSSRKARAGTRSLEIPPIRRRKRSW